MGKFWPFPVRDGISRVSTLQFIVQWARKFFAFRSFDKIAGYNIRSVKGKFYIEYLSGGGINMQSVNAKHLIRKRGRYYLYGWCESFPSYRTVPIEQITALADEETGELIPPTDIIPWLMNRSLH